MSRWKKRIGCAGAIVVLLLAVGLAVAWWRWLAPLPAMSGSARAAGLAASLEVVRDGYGIPHVRAAGERDAVWATGFLHGQDRLFQMDLLRRFPAGRLAEIFGGAALGTDRAARRRGHTRRARQRLDGLSAAERDLLQAYADGVNAAVAGMAALPPEYAVLRAGFEPWEPLHSVLVVRAMQDRLTESSREITRLRMARRIGIRAATFLMDGRLVEDAVILEDADDPAGAPGETLRLLEAEAEALGLPLDPPEPDVTQAGAARPGSDGRWAGMSEATRRLVTREEAGRGLGSNSWVVGGGRAVAGAPLLANDTHLPVELPSSFYLVDLEWQGVHVAGSTVPGFPGVVIGRNESVAWGITILTVDAYDYAVERVTADGTAYVTQQGSVPFEIIDEVIRVKGGESVTESVRVSRHGPVVDPDWQAGEVLVRIDHEPQELGELQAVRGYAQARDFDDLHRSARLHGWPPENLTVATTAGEVGYIAAGAIPERQGRSGLLPLAGWRSEQAFAGWDPVEGRPFLLAGDEAALATANNRVLPGRRGESWNRSWIRADRATRAAHLLEETPLHDVDSARRMQSDTHWRQAAGVMEALRAMVTEGEIVLSDGSDAARAWELLSRWYGYHGDGEAPGVFALFWSALERAAFADDIGSGLAPAADAGLLKLLGFRFRELPAAAAGARDWWDDTSTPARESRGEQVVRALSDAWQEMNRRSPARPWNWSALHQVRFAHPLGRTAGLDRLFNGPDVPVQGAGGCLLATAFRAGRSFDAVALPAMRMIADLSPSGGLQMVLTLGQSGIPSSPHYADQSPLWSRTGAIPIFGLSGDPAGHRRLRLEPAP